MTFWQDIDDREFLSTLSLRRATHSYAEFMTWGAFLSTLSLRRATRQTYQLNEKQAFLSTLSLRRATQVKQTCRAKISISIHALLAESDETLVILPKQLDDFYPRSPCGERR